MNVAPLAMALVAKERNYDTPLWVLMSAAALPEVFGLVPLPPAASIAIPALIGALLVYAASRRAEGLVWGAALGAIGAGVQALTAHGLDAAWWALQVSVAVGGTYWFTLRTITPLWKKMGVWLAMMVAVVVFSMQGWNP